MLAEHRSHACQPHRTVDPSGPRQYLSQLPDRRARQPYRYSNLHLRSHPRETGQLTLTPVIDSYVNADSPPPTTVC
jgi:hypothetical protein